MKRWLAILCLACAATVMAHAGTLINLEEAAEIEELRINADGASSAYIYARICDGCELLKLRLDNGSRILRARQSLTIADAVALRGKGATVLFDPQTMTVTRILYWN